MFSDDEKKVLEDFYTSIKMLKMMEIVRSDNIFGDIGEYLCTKVYPRLQRVQSKINPYYDAIENGKKIQIKFSDSKDTKNIDVGNPDKYDGLIVVLGPNSVHRYANEVAERKNKILFYRFSSKEVKAKFKIQSDHYTLCKRKQFRKADAELNAAE